ncbi:hypothetical protein BC830DRAFT_793690 [Chytriomyces sp. MP71]|nr:hypothetical protein BC830DRAFT_793690 [Chytriomyces sp. MP71]
MEAFTRRHSTIRRKSESGSEDSDPQTLQKLFHTPELNRTRSLHSGERPSSSASTLNQQQIAVGRPNLPRRSDSLTHSQSTSRSLHTPPTYVSTSRGLHTPPTHVSPLPSPVASPISTWTAIGFPTRSSESPGTLPQAVKYEPHLHIATPPNQSTARENMPPCPSLLPAFCTTDNGSAMPEVEFIPLPIPKAVAARSRSTTVEKSANTHLHSLASASAVAPRAVSRSKSLSRSSSKTRELIV